jgi:hypothetical protein
MRRLTRDLRGPSYGSETCYRSVRESLNRVLPELNLLNPFPRRIPCNHPDSFAGR